MQGLNSMHLGDPVLTVKPAQGLDRSQAAPHMHVCCNRIIVMVLTYARYGPTRGTGGGEYKGVVALSYFGTTCTSNPPGEPTRRAGERRW